MERALFIFFVFISVCSYSQNIPVIGLDTSTGRPGHIYTLKPQYTSTPLYAVNDSTIGSHAIDSLKRTPGTVGVYGRKNGVFVWQYDDSVGTGGGGGEVIQTITATATINSTTTILVVDPASLVAAMTITMPSGTAGQRIWIVFGGTITGGSAVVTALTISGTVVSITSPTKVYSGECIGYIKAGSYWYRLQ